MAAGVETKIRELLREARHKESEKNIGIVKDALATIKQRTKWRPPPIPATLPPPYEEYAVKITENGKPPVFYVKYASMPMVGAYGEKIRAKYCGFYELWAVATRGEFTLSVGFKITYKPAVHESDVVFTITSFDCFVVPNDGMPTKPRADVLCAVYDFIVHHIPSITHIEDHLSDFGSCRDLESRLLDKLQQQPKRARTE